MTTPRAWNLIWLSVYAISMALLEAAVVVYMRRLYYPDNQMELFPLSFLHVYDPRLELAREASTILMILAVAVLTERSTPTRTFAAFVFVFGLWDLFYYVWLKFLMDWPRTWWEWDVLFLIPNIWLGPWICPALIACLFVCWGTWALLVSKTPKISARGLATFVFGAAFGLLSFLQPAYEVQQTGGDITKYIPQGFWWWLYWLGFVLMAAGFWMTDLPSTESSKTDFSHGSTS